jgi:hypothetical protein
VWVARLLLALARVLKKIACTNELCGELCVHSGTSLRSSKVTSRRYCSRHALLSWSKKLSRGSVWGTVPCTYQRGVQHLPTATSPGTTALSRPTFTLQVVAEVYAISTAGPATRACIREVLGHLNNFCLSTISASLSRVCSRLYVIACTIN